MEFTGEAIRSSFFVERFVIAVITDSISLLVIFLFLHDPVPGGFCISRNLSISTKLSNLCTVAHSTLEIPFILWILMFLLPFPTLVSSVFSLSSLVHLGEGLSVLLMFSKSKLLVSLAFFTVFLFSVLFISALIFIISFLLLALRVVLSSSSSGSLDFKDMLLT